MNLEDEFDPDLVVDGLRDTLPKILEFEDMATLIYTILIYYGLSERETAVMFTAILHRMSLEAEEREEFKN